MKVMNDVELNNVVGGVRLTEKQKKFGSYALTVLGTILVTVGVDEAIHNKSKVASWFKKAPKVEAVKVAAVEAVEPAKVEVVENNDNTTAEAK